MDAFARLNVAETLGLSKFLDDVKVDRKPVFTQWQNPEESIGARYGKLGKCHYWELRGRAREQYFLLSNEIKEHLETHGEAVTATVIWSAYMVGRSTETANPTVFFSCKERSARKKVKKEIDQSGIPSRYGFKTGDSSRPPHLDKLRQLAGGNTTASGPSGHRATTCTNPIGRRIEVSPASHSFATRRATLGAILQCDDTLYFTTAAHAFMETVDESEFDFQDDSDLECDFDDYSDSCTDGDANGAAEKDDIELSTVAKHIAARTSTTEAVVETSHSCLGAYNAREVVFSSIGGPLPYLDYCLVELKANDPRLFGNNAQPESKCTYHTVYPENVSSPVPHDGAVVAYTGSRKAFRGVISGTPIVLTLRGGQSSQELWSVQFEGALDDGDCGSIVLNEATGELEGHIVAGNPTTGVALIVPAYQILNDLRQRFHRKIRFSTRFKDCQPSVIRTPNLAAHVQTVLNSTRRKGLPEHRRDTDGRDVMHQEGRVLDGTTSYNAVGSLSSMTRSSRSQKSLRFRRMLLALSRTPVKWENSGLLDEALESLPLQQIYDEAEDESNLLRARAMSLDENASPTWGYQDCVIRALMKWFRGFFQWIDNPSCTVCGCPTIAAGNSSPLPEEAGRGASGVEIYQCIRKDCASTERFPRYNDAFVLMLTRRGRNGEWANCFSMLCRAVGSQVRWVWSIEGHVWTEIYSYHCKRWIHVDVCEGAWDEPLIYTRGWGKKLSYCIAFSTEGATDVTDRYVQCNSHALSRDLVEDEELPHILAEICDLRRKSLSIEERIKLRRNDLEEGQELRRYAAERFPRDLRKTASTRRVVRSSNDCGVDASVDFLSLRLQEGGDNEQRALGAQSSL